MIQNLSEIANDLLQHADIVEVASHYVKLERRGRNFVCLCPFHDDKSIGNFSINKEKGVFKCFSCGTAGNAINFVQKIENISFEEAVIKTAELVGYKNEDLERGATKRYIDPKKQKLYDCLKDISTFYENSLYLTKDGENAKQYLSNRGLNEDVAKAFHIGYAQQNGENVVAYLKKKGYSYEEIASTGIITLSRTPYRDVNSNRIAFPIADRNGNVVGFSCRRFAPQDDDKAKYINTSSTQLFNKSTILYNFHQALQECRKTNYIYVLEGFMDVIAAYRVGIKSAVALMGTALTPEHIQLLRYTKAEIRLCLDLDLPGQENMKKIAAMLEKNGVNYKLVSNNVDFKEKDADEILTNHGEAKLRSYLSNLISVGEWLINFYSRNLDLNVLENKKTLIKNLIPYLRSLNSAYDYEYYLNKISSITNFSKELIDENVKKTKEKKVEISEDVTEEEPLNFAKKTKVERMTRLQLAEMQVLQYMLENEEAFEIYKKELGYFVNPTYKVIANLIEEYRQTLPENEHFDVKGMIAYLSGDEFKSPKKAEIIDIVSSAAFDAYQIPSYSDEIFKELIYTINSEKAEADIKRSFESIKKENPSGDTASYAKIYLIKKKELLEKKDKKRRK